MEGNDKLQAPSLYTRIAGEWALEPVLKLYRRENPLVLAE
jgi:hypothetical protein